MTLTQSLQQVKYLTVEEFANLIGVHPQTVRAWDRQGVLPAHHKTYSGRRLYTKEQAEAYLNNN